MSDVATPPYFVAIGASGAEGLTDIRQLLSAFPPSLDAVVLVVLHRPSDRESDLRSILAAGCLLPVIVAHEGDGYRAGTCYIGEPDDHLALAARSRVALIEGADHKYRNRTVDLLFSSVAALAGSRAVGVVLSGSLSDGSEGLAAIHRAGGKTMVLGYEGDARSGMPRNATEYDGPVDFIGSVVGIAREIRAIVGSG